MNNLEKFSSGIQRLVDLRNIETKKAMMRKKQLKNLTPLK